MTLKKVLFIGIFILLFLSISSNASELRANGTHFELNNSEYLNITLDSKESIKLVLKSVPEIITMRFESISGATSTNITLGGFDPQTTYHKYEDTYHNHTIFTTDPNGNYTYVQDISKQHLVFIQPRHSTRFINDNYIGGDCILIGSWKADTRTCTLTADLTETIQIDSDGIILDGGGHSITGSNTGNGIYLSGRNGVTIKNLDIKGFSYGIYLYSSSNNNLVDNIASNNRGEGIYLWYSNYNTLSGNTANSNWDGIELDSSGGNTLSNNIGNSNRYLGIWLDYSDNSILNDNIGNSNGYQGIWLESSGGSTLSNNVANSNGYQGIWLDYSDNTTLNGNTANSNGYQGIWLESSGGSTLSNNAADSNGYQGVWLDYSDNSILNNNTANLNGYEGIYIDDSSNGILRDNTASKNYAGISLYSPSNSNLLYHNDMIDNIGYNAYDEGTNQWNSGTEGNYYSDYTGVDANNDGIGDTSYPILGGISIDRYPLMAPYSSIPGIIPRNVRIAVILAEPSDGSHNTSHDKFYYLTNIIPQLKEYYKEVSYGAVNIIINSEDIYDNNGNWYKLGKTAAYYGRNITYTRGDGTTYEDGSDNSTRFLFDAIETADLDINFSNYDAVIVLHANKSQQELRGNWDLMTTHAWPYDYTTSNGDTAKNLILNSEYELMGTWSHETGHALGRILQPRKPPYYLPDRYGDSNGNHSIGNWDLMGSGNWLGVPAGSNPDHMSSFSKDWLGWLNNKSVGYGTYWINSLATMNYGDETTRYITKNIPPTNYLNYYIIETRTNNPAYSRWDTSAPIPYGYNNSLVLYQVADYGKGNSTVDFIKNLIPWGGTPYADYSSYWDFASKLRFTALDERARTVGTKPLFEMEVGIDNFSIPWLVGAILEPENNLLGYVPWYSWSSPLNTKTPLPDIDLHAYTLDGKHVGMNYTTGIYENEIPGANASGDLLNGREWIFVPDNIKVQFVVDSRDNQNFLNSYPELQRITNGTQSYNLTLVYDVLNDVRYSASTEQSIQPGDVMEYNYSIARNSDGTYKLVLDETPPTIFNTIPQDITNNSQISAEFADNPDGSGINSSSISLIIDNINVTQNATITDNSISINPTLQDGLYNVRLTVSDKAGNIATTNWNVTLDTVPPVIQLYPANGTEFYSDQNLTINYTVTDATSGVATSSITLDSAAVVKDDLIDLRILTIGSHIIQVIANDNAGNRAESSITFVIKPLQAIVEIEPHTLNINSNGKWIEAKIQIPGHNASLINISSIRLNGTIPVDIKFKEIEKDEKDTASHDNDKELKVKFNRTMVQSIISPSKVTLYISGEVNGAIFMGNDTIKVIKNPKGDDTEKEKSEEDNKNKGSGGKS